MKKSSPQGGPKLRVRVSDAEPEAQEAPIFSSDEEDGGSGSRRRDMRGEWPHEFKFRPQIEGGVGKECAVCGKDFVRICTACGKCMECFRGGNRECVEGATASKPPPRRLSPPPDDVPDEREWPEYPRTMTRYE